MASLTGTFLVHCHKLAHDNIHLTSHSWNAIKLLLGCGTMKFHKVYIVMVMDRRINKQKISTKSIIHFVFGRFYNLTQTKGYSCMSLCIGCKHIFANTVAYRLKFANTVFHQSGWSFSKKACYCKPHSNHHTINKDNKISTHITLGCCSVQLHFPGSHGTEFTGQWSVLLFISSVIVFFYSYHKRFLHFTIWPQVGTDWLHSGMVTSHYMIQELCYLASQ